MWRRAAAGVQLPAIGLLQVEQELATDDEDGDGAGTEAPVDDDRLRLVFTCCHPALKPEAQVALTLREVCGLTTEEIAHAFTRLGLPFSLDGDAFVVTAFVRITGGVDSPMSFLYLLPIAVASILLVRRGGLILAAVCFALYAMLVLHGAGVRSASLGGAAGWAGKGFLALDINAHGIPNGRPAEFYKNLADGELKDYRGRGRESRC